MTQDGNVQPETTSTTPVAGAVSTEQVTPVPTQPSVEETVRKLVEEQMTKFTEQSKREIQSTKDKARAEVEAVARRAAMAEGTLTSVRARLQQEDPEKAALIELEELRGREKLRQQTETEDQLRRQKEEFDKSFRESLVETITEMGIDPAAKDIDWAENETNYINRQKAILKSAAKIQKENQKTERDTLDKRLKELEAKVSGVDVEANSVSTSSSGTASGGKKIYTEAEISDYDFWKKNKADIELAKKEGRIKT